jgi:hypothetical protein
MNNGVLRWTLGLVAAVLKAFPLQRTHETWLKPLENMPSILSGCRLQETEWTRSVTRVEAG